MNILLNRRLIFLIPALTTFTFASAFAGTLQNKIHRKRALPIVSIASPSADGSYINSSNKASILVSGTCSANNQSVVISGAASATVLCSSLAWSTNLDFSAIGDGAVSINVNHSDANGNRAPTVTRSFIKDTISPSFSISTPSSDGTAINTKNVSAVQLAGYCSDNGQYINISGAISAAVLCSGNSWSKSLDFSGVAEGAVSLKINYSDAAGNSSPALVRSFQKDTVLPTVSISTPNANNTFVNIANQSAITVSGSCSENGRNVFISGAALATVPCIGNAWSTVLDFTGIFLRVADGPISIKVDHSDSAGNIALSATRIFQKDTVPPAIFITSPSIDGTAINLANQSSVNISGTCSENGRAVNISGAITASAICTANAWSAVLNFSSVSDGVVKINIDHMDSAGNMASSATRSFLKDTLAPSVSILKPNTDGSFINIANKNAVQVSGSCSENGQNIFISGAASATVPCSANVWSTTLDFSEIADGKISININHMDSAGNQAASSTRSFVKDTILPTVSISVPATDGSIINNSNMAAVPLSGSCSENGQNIVLSGALSASVLCASNAWSTSLNFTSVADGNITIIASHTDAAGNGSSSTRNFVKNTIASLPTLSITIPAANGSFINGWNQTAIALAGACSANGQNIVLSGGASGIAVCSANAWSTKINFTAASDGTVSLIANHSDSSGNAAPTATRSFIKDTVLPTVAFTLPVADGSLINNINKSSVAVAGTCSENGQSVLISGAISAAPVCTANKWSTNLNFSAVADGTVSIKILHIDVAGNASLSGSRTFIKNTSLPMLTITSPATDGSYINIANKASVPIAGSCSANGQNVLVSGALSASAVCASNAWSSNLNFSSVTDGAAIIKLDHTDAAGNAAIAVSRSFIKDTVIPTVSITVPAADGAVIDNTNKAAVALAGTCSENGQAINLSGSITSTAICVANAWSASLNLSSVADGAVTLSAAQLDLAGNSSLIISRSFVKNTATVPSPITPSPGLGTLTGVWANNGEDKVAQSELRFTKKGATAILNKTWDGTSINLFGAKNEVIGFNIILESAIQLSSSVSVSFNQLVGPGGATIQSAAATGAGVYDWTKRNIEQFYVRYVPIKGLSLLSYEQYDERHIPARFQRPYTGAGIGSGLWTDRPDHDLYYPDIAVPLEWVPIFNIAAGKNQSVWTDIYIPKTAPSGIYTGTISINSAASGISYKLPVKLAVRNFTLPDVPNAKSMLFVGYQDIGMRYLGVSWPNAGTAQATSLKLIRDRHFLVAHRHKISLIDDHQGPEVWTNDAPRPEWQNRLNGNLFTAANGYDGPGIATGNNIFSIGTYGSWSWKSGTQTDMQNHTNAWEQWFQSNSPSTERLLYLVDESTNYTQTEQWANWVSTNPGIGSNLPTFATMALPSRTNTPSLSISASWMSVGDANTWQNAANLVSSNPKKKFYMYNGKRPASGSFATEDDGISLRELPWGQYKKGVSRWFFWESTYYNDTQGGRGQTNVFQNANTFGGTTTLSTVNGETGWNHSNGDGVLFYPGTDTVYPAESYAQNGPIASLRLKYWRRGIQDIDYLNLAKAINPTRVQQIVNSLVPKVLWENGVSDPADPTWVRTDISWPTNPDVWEAYRKELADIIDGGVY